MREVVAETATADSAVFPPGEIRGKRPFQRRASQMQGHKQNAQPACHQQSPVWLALRTEGERRERQERRPVVS